MNNTGEVPNTPDEKAEAERGFARYQHLRANVAKRRTWYKTAIVLALLIFVGSLVDILFLRGESWNERLLEYAVYGCYALLFIVCVVLLFSRKQHAKDMQELHVLESAFLVCDACQSVFQYGEVNFQDRKRIGFTCPACGEESALPTPDRTPVEMLLPDGPANAANYHCKNCSEDIRIATFGTTPRKVKFDACPHCGIAGKVVAA